MFILGEAMARTRVRGLDSEQTKSAALPSYKTRLMDAMIDAGALKLGEKGEDYRLKVGGYSPYFVNVGGMNTGNSITALATAYASTIADGKAAMEVVASLLRNGN